MNTIQKYVNHKIEVDKYDYQVSFDYQ
ncbi:TPA: colicin E3-like toxin immunity protein [Proteus mirabilis]